MEQRLVQPAPDNAFLTKTSLATQIKVTPNRPPLHHKVTKCIYSLLWLLIENGLSPYCYHWTYCCCCSVAKSHLTLCGPMNCSTPGFPVLHHLLEFAQTHVHWVGDAIQPLHLLLPPSPPALNLFQHQGLFQWVGSSHQVTKVLEFQLQHQSFQWIFKVDFL